MDTKKNKKNKERKRQIQQRYFESQSRDFLPKYRYIFLLLKFNRINIQQRNL